MNSVQEQDNEYTNSHSLFSLFTKHTHKEPVIFLKYINLGRVENCSSGQAN